MIKHLALVFLFICKIYSGFAISYPVIPPAPTTVHYDTSADMAYVNVNHVFWKRFEDSVDRLYLGLEKDNLATYARIHWEVRSTVVEGDVTMHKIVDFGTYILEGTNYTDWTGDIVYIFEYMAALDTETARINVTIAD